MFILARTALSSQAVADLADFPKAYEGSNTLFDIALNPLLNIPTTNLFVLRLYLLLHLLLW